jgi:hypothetical protein
MNVGIQVGALSNNCGYDTGYDMIPVIGFM